MNQTTDETRLREMIQRLKCVDEQLAPDFNDVLECPVRKPIGRPTRPLLWAVVCCTAAMLVAAVLLVRSRHVAPNLATDPRNLATDPRNAEHIGPKQPGDLTYHQSPQQRVADIDFDHLRQVVQEHCRAAEMANGVRMPVWSSRTESLLAWNNDISLTQE